MISTRHVTWFEERPKTPKQDGCNLGVEKRLCFEKKSILTDTTKSVINNFHNKLSLDSSPDFSKHEAELWNGKCSKQPRLVSPEDSTIVSAKIIVSMRTYSGVFID